MAFCANCGISVADNARFCGQCGMQRFAPIVEQNQYIPQPPGFAPMEDQSRVIAVLSQAKMIMPTVTSDIYTIVFTPNQAIMAKLTAEVLQDVQKRAQAQGKADGKGWLGRAGDQMRVFSTAHLRYFEMIPEQILAETPGNFSIAHAAVNAVNIRLVDEPANYERPADPYDVEVVFNTSIGLFKYLLSMRIKEVVKIISGIYPGRVTEKK